MARNRKFKNVYVITVQGKTTNGFIAKVVDGVLKELIKAIGVGYQQVSTNVKVLESYGDFDAETGELREDA
jgi:hypothetical protein